MKKHAAQAAAWALALAVTLCITRTGIQHHMPPITLITIALCVGYTAKAGFDNIANAIRAARTKGPAR